MTEITPDDCDFDMFACRECSYNSFPFRVPKFILRRHKVFRASREDSESVHLLIGTQTLAILDSAVEFRFATHAHLCLRASACFALCPCCTRTCPKGRTCRKSSVLPPLYMIDRNKLAKHCVLDALSQTSYFLFHYDDKYSSPAENIHAPKRVYISRRASCFPMIQAMPFFCFILD
jgi:hypothetical protein